jgi:hypothetical protein
MICSNYRPITLLNVAYKIFTILTNSRLSSIVERKLEDFQMGFQPNRSTIDNIFRVRQIIEKCHEFNIELHRVFIDYTQAFDSVYRDKIIKCLNKYDILSKLIQRMAKTRRRRRRMRRRKQRRRRRRSRRRRRRGGRRRGEEEKEGGGGEERAEGGGEKEEGEEGEKMKKNGVHTFRKCILCDRKHQ